MRNFIRFLGTAVLTLFAGVAAVQAADIRVLCSNVIQFVMPDLADTFRLDTGNRVEFVYGTSPAMVKRLAAGEAADVVVITQRVFDEAVKAGHVVAGSRAEIGRIGVGLAVRAGVAIPDISTPDALKRAVLGADSLFYGERASGRHFARVLERLGVASEVMGKSKRYPTSTQVIEQVLNGRGQDIGVAPLPEILAQTNKDLRLVGPLPAELQNHEPYSAGLTVNAQSPDAARSFVKFLTSSTARKALAAIGVDQPK